ncbi:hypothetical protein HGRIS_000435 [Hohenbuehelia grisea]|uniref:DUF5648 domain-containing protein n=1 Tax=Hohenbuehelia grisea TaxID=104357 RepID=A0ABR3JSZ6_9AGAR
MFATRRELQKFKALGYEVETIAGYVYPKALCGAIPLHGFWSKPKYHEYTIYDSEKPALGSLEYQGITGFVYLPSTITPPTIHEVGAYANQHCEANKKYLISVIPLWHTVQRDMVYVTTEVEATVFRRKGYLPYAESKGWKMFSKNVPGSVPLYRLYNSHPSVVDHMFATAEKKGEWLKRGYTQEGIAGYIYPDNRCGTKRLHQLWQGFEYAEKAYSAQSIYRKVGRSHQDHEYAVDEREVHSLTHTWKYENQGCVGYVYDPSTPSSGSVY